MSRRFFDAHLWLIGIFAALSAIFIIAFILTKHLRCNISKIFDVIAAWCVVMFFTLLSLVPVSMYLLA